MPQMLTLSNGRPETILSPKDFEDLIDKHRVWTVRITIRIR